MFDCDVLVLGGGAAGLMCAGTLGRLAQNAGKRMRIAVVDHAPVLAEKIRISGGGRCNFTNRRVGPAHFITANPGFPDGILRAYPSDAFIEWLESEGVQYHEKHKGQLFCNGKSQAIIDVLLNQCKATGVALCHPHRVLSVGHDGSAFTVQLDPPSIQLGKVHNNKTVRARCLVVATGGLPVPKIGATDFGLHLAKQFGHALVEHAPALVPLEFEPTLWQPWAELAGVAMPVRINGGLANQAPWFDEDLLWTHRGLSGPAVLQASSYWRPGQPLSIQWLPNAVGSVQLSSEQLVARLMSYAQGSKMTLIAGVQQLWRDVGLDGVLAKRVLHTLLDNTVQHKNLPSNGQGPANSAAVVCDRPFSERRLSELGKKQLQPLAQVLAGWRIMPSRTAGYAKAEVMRGGVCTRGLCPQTLQSKHCQGLYFIGEVVDVTGWLGGYNFQWAWASAVAAARAIVQ